MKINKYIQSVTLLLLLGLPSLATAKKRDQVPQFRDYPVNSAYIGKPAKVVLASAGEKMFRTRLRAASEQPANFAGDYVFTSWGCGTTCVIGAVVSLKSGRVVFLPNSSCCWEGEGEKFEFRINSRLLVVAGIIDAKNGHGAHFYEFTGREFKYLKTIPVARE